MVGAAAIVLSPLSAAAQTSPWVPVGDPAYEDVEWLVARGLVGSAFLGEVPFTEAEFARIATEAGRTSPIPDDRTRESLARLHARFVASESGSAQRSLVRVGVGLADTRARQARTGLPQQRIDAVIDPLAQRAAGRSVPDGGSSWGEAVVLAAPGPVALGFTPRATVRGNGESSLEVVEAWGRFEVGPLALGAGRLNAAWGHGLRRGPMLSGQARGIDQIRVSSRWPGRLPGALRRLGRWRASAALAHLGEDRDIPGARALLMRVSGRPSRFLEFGLTYTNVQGGDGAPEAAFWDRVRDVLLLPDRTPTTPDGRRPGISNKVLGGDLRLDLPSLHSSFALHFATTDDRGFFSEPGRGYTEDALWSVAWDLRGIGPGGRWDARAAWVRSGAIAHAHSQFTSGMAVDGRVLGDALGPHADGTYAEISRTGSRLRTSVQLARELYSRDRFFIDSPPGPEGPEPLPWEKIEDFAEEVRTRLSLHARTVDLDPRWAGELRLGVERVSRFDFSEVDRTNMVLEVVIERRW